MPLKDTNDDDLIGVLIAGRYRIISRLGAGGMGVAYRAWDEQDGVPVVIKIPKKAFLEDPKFKERFYREIRLLQGLNHPHIGPITDVGEHEGVPFVVLRFLPGGSLSNRRLRDNDGRPRPNPASMLRLWLPAVAEALDYVHSQGVVHRDVKPANIFFDAFWGAYLGDFGIAKVVEESDTFDKEHTLTATHMGLGTPEYMAPEQFTPKAAIDGKADQYALAVMVYEMLAGSRPFTGSTSNLIVEVLTHPVPSIALHRRDLPQSLIEAVHKGLAKNPAKRFPTCREFAATVLRDVPPMEDEPGVARLLCPQCANILKLPTEAAGQKGKCPKCQSRMKVAEDLGALWLLDEAGRQQNSEATAEGGRLAPDSHSASETQNDEALAAFKPISSTTPIAKAYRRQKKASSQALVAGIAAAVLLVGVLWFGWSILNSGKSKPVPYQVRLASALKKLEGNPSDPAANGFVGQHWCLKKRDWAKGLPYLAKSDVIGLSGLAEQEGALGASRPANAGDFVRIAEEWWRRAGEKEIGTPEAVFAIQEHAAELYRQNVKSLTADADVAMANRWLDRDGEFQKLVGNKRPSPPGLADDPFAMSNGQVWKNSLGMEFVLLPTGRYASHKMAGYQKGDAVEVQITKKFLIGCTEVKQSQWTSVMKSEPWKGQKDTFVAPNCPATYVTWQEAVDFCATLTKREREAGTLPATLAYRLPTESQWEYACRAGTTSDFSFGDEKRVGEYVWELFATVHNVAPDQSYAHEVAKKKPNPWGLFDTHGNVKEWCLDWDGEFSGGEDPQGPPDGTAKICRGGAWHHGPLDCRSLRNPYDRANPSERSSGVGVRVVLERTPDAAQGPPSDPVANRVAAEWALGLKANIEIETADRKRQRVDSPANLPASPFVVVSINLPSNAGVKAGDLQVLKPLNRLESLGFGGNPITDDLFDHICDLPKLKAMGANWTGVTGAGLARLKNARLVGIDASGVQNIMPALQSFKVMASLEWINFDRVDIPQVGFAIIAEMKTLKQLWFRKGLISDDNLKYLKQQLPSCNITLHQ